MSMIRIKHILEVPQHIQGIRAVVFDLDDTLYSEKGYVKSGFAAIADCFPQVDAMQQKLWDVFLRGGKAIDEVLQSENLYQQENVNLCLQTYRFHQPTIALYPGVEDMLIQLKKQGYMLGLITDGRPEGQRAKIQALGLDRLFDSIIITDELGGVQTRKPNPLAYQIVQQQFAVPFAQMAYIGDNPSKDFIAGQQLGMRNIYFANPDGLYYKNRE